MIITEFQVQTTGAADAFSVYEDLRESLPDGATVVSNFYEGVSITGQGSDDQRLIIFPVRSIDDDCMAEVSARFVAHEDVAHVAAVRSRTTDNDPLDTTPTPVKTA